MLEGFLSFFRGEDDVKEQLKELDDLREKREEEIKQIVHLLRNGRKKVRQ